MTPNTITPGNPIYPHELQAHFYGAQRAMRIMLEVVFQSQGEAQTASMHALHVRFLSLVPNTHSHLNNEPRKINVEQPFKNRSDQGDGRISTGTKVINPDCFLAPCMVHQALLEVIPEHNFKNGTRAPIKVTK